MVMPTLIADSSMVSIVARSQTAAWWPYLQRWSLPAATAAMA